MCMRTYLADSINKKRLAYFLVLTILVFFTFGKVLGFSFWKDDWGYFWTTANNVPYTVFFLHPGTLLEFFLLIPIFGKNIFLWQLTGLVLKIIASYTVFQLTRSLTKNEKAGYIAGIFIAVTYLGMDAVGWVSAHIMLINSIMLCMSITLFIRCLEQKKKKHGVFFFASSIVFLILDPGRNIILFPLLLVYLFLFCPKILRSGKFVRIAIGVVGVSIIVSAVLLSRPFAVIGLSSLDYLNSTMTSPLRIIGKLYVIQRYFHTFGVMLVGWWYPLTEFDNTLSYSRLTALTGCMLFLGFLSTIYIFLKKRSTPLAIILFCFSILFFSYLPNWLFEPRLIIGGTHRYMTVSMIGFIMLLSYSLSGIRARGIAYFLAGLFIFGNIVSVRKVLDTYEKERSSPMTQRIYQSFDEMMPKHAYPSIILITGDHPIINPGFYFSMPASLAVTGDLHRIDQMPWYIRDFNGSNYEMVVSLLCQKVPSWSVYKRTVTVPQGLAPSQIFHFIVNKSGPVMDESIQTRKMVGVEAEKRGCELSYE